MKNLISIFSILILIASCKKEPNNQPIDNNPIVDSVYYINQTFEMNFDEKSYIIDTTKFVQYEDSLVHPKYRVEILSIDEQRCDYNACSVCFGGFVYVDVKLTSSYFPNYRNDTLDYPSCTDGFLSGNGAVYGSLKLDSIELDLLRVFPQPGSEQHHFELGYIPNDEYQISFKLEKQF